MGPISLEVYIRVTSPESPHRVPAHSPKKTDKGRGVSRYVTTRRNPLVCTGRTAGKSPPTDTQGDHEGARGGMRRPRGDHEAIMRGHEVLSPVSFPTFGLLLYYNTQAALGNTTRTLRCTPDHHAYTQVHTRPPRVHMAVARSTSGCVKVISENTNARTHNADTC